MITPILIAKNFADNWARVFVVMTFLVLEAANTYLAKAAIVGGIIPNLIAFVLFLGKIGYFALIGKMEEIFGWRNKN